LQFDTTNVVWVPKNIVNTREATGAKERGLIGMKSGWKALIGEPWITHGNGAPPAECLSAIARLSCPPRGEPEPASPAGRKHNRI
jgi:hypothetical protein